MNCKCKEPFCVHYMKTRILADTLQNELCRWPADITIEAMKIAMKKMEDSRSTEQNKIAKAVRVV